MSLRTHIDAKLPRIPKVATNGMKIPSTIFETLRSSDIVTDVRPVLSLKISGPRLLKTTLKMKVRLGFKGKESLH